MPAKETLELLDIAEGEHDLMKQNSRHFRLTFGSFHIKSPNGPMGHISDLLQILNTESFYRKNSILKISAQ